MATIPRNDESLVERDEVLYPNSDFIDTEPYYDNFTTIQNAIRHQNEQRQMNVMTHSRSYSSDDDLYRAVRTQVEPLSSSSTLHHYHSNEMIYRDIQPSSTSFTVPVNIQSKKVDGHVFNLIQIVEDIGYKKNRPVIRLPPNPNTKNVSALLNIVLKMGGAYGPLTTVWRSRINSEYFQRWYLEKYDKRYASLIQYNTMNNNNDQISNQTTQNIRTRDYQSNKTISNLASTLLPMQQTTNDKIYDKEVKQIFGYDDVDTTSSVSSYTSSSYDTESKTNKPPTITSILKKSNGQNSSPKHHVTIREDNRINDVHQSASTQHVLSDYQQLIQKHPDLNNDPNPQIITKPNPEQVTYQQNVSVRYLVPPTPPPPGPLIIREVVPPSPPPLVIHYQEPSPPTPPPLILREAPPPPPPRQEATVITKVLPPEPQPPRRVIVEQTAPLPPKPQSIIIEKWLPYKPAPPQEVIYEHVTEKSSAAEFEPAALHIERQRRHSAEYESNLSRVSIPVNIQRRNSLEYIEQNQVTSQPSGTFDELAWSTHQQIIAMQQQGREQVRAHQQWAANQWQQHANMFLQYPTQLTTPSLVVYHQPVTRSYVQTQEYRQEQRVLYNPTFIYPFF